MPNSIKSESAMPKLTLFTKNPPRTKETTHWRVSRTQGYFIDSSRADHLNPFYLFTPFIASVELYGLTRDGKGSVQIACDPQGAPIKPHNMYQVNGRVTAFFQIPSLWECVWAFFENSNLMTFQKYDAIDYKTLQKLGEDQGMAFLQEHVKKLRDMGHDLAVPEIPASAATWRAIESLLFKKPIMKIEQFKKDGPENWEELISQLKSKPKPDNRGTILYADLSNWRICENCSLYIKANHKCTCNQEAESLK